MNKNVEKSATLSATSENQKLAVAYDSFLVEADENLSLFSNFLTMFGAEKTAVLCKAISQWEYSVPLFVSSNGDVLTMLNYEDWQHEYLYGTYCVGEFGSCSHFVPASTPGLSKAGKWFVNFEKVILGFSEPTPECEEHDFDGMQEKVMTYLIQHANVPVQPPLMNE